MKKYRVFLSLILSATMLFLLCGCNQYKGPYVFWRQSRENIQKVEICTYEDNVQTVIFELPADEVDTFLDEVSNLEYLQLIGDHGITGIGEISVLVTYINGEKELISNAYIGCFSQDGKFHPDRYIVNDDRAFFDLICKYASTEVVLENLPNLKNEYVFWFDEDGNLIPTEELE